MLTFDTEILISGIRGANPTTLTRTAQRDVATTVDLSIGTSLSMTTFLNESTSSFSRKLRQLTAVQISNLLYVIVHTTVRTSAFPQFSTPAQLYAYLTQILDAALSSGAMSKTLQTTALQTNESTLYTAYCLSTAYSNMQVISTPTVQPTKAPIIESPSGKLTGGMIGLTVAFVLIGAVLIAAFMYFCGRYIYNRTQTVKTVKNFTSASLGNISESYPNRQTQSFSLTNFDIDKLEYEGDVVYQC